MATDESTPYIERPDEHEVTGDQLFCWIQWNRECGGDCTAYEELASHDQRLTFCKVLNSIRSAAFAFNGIFQAAKSLTDTSQQQKKRESAEELRQRIESIPPPPKVSP